MAIGVLHLTLKIWLVAEASRRFLEDRKDNTFELLLSTRLSVRQIIRGQWLALWKQFGGPMIAVLAVQTALIFRGMQYFHDQSGATLLPLYLAGMFFLVADSVALGWAGMWFGLRSKSRVQAMLSGLVLVLLSRVLIVGAAMSLVAASINGSEFSRLEALLTFCAGLSIDLSVIILARSSLIRNFRKMAAAQFNVKKWGMPVVS